MFDLAVGVKIYDGTHVFSFPSVKVDDTRMYRTNDL